MTLSRHANAKYDFPVVAQLLDVTFLNRWRRGPLRQSVVFDRFQQHHRIATVLPIQRVCDPILVLGEADEQYLIKAADHANFLTDHIVHLPAL